MNFWFGGLGGCGARRRQEETAQDSRNSSAHQVTMIVLSVYTDIKEIGMQSIRR
jgi:hypothetical protein